MPGAGSDLVVARRGDDQIEAERRGARRGPLWAADATPSSPTRRRAAGCERVTWRSAEPTPAGPRARCRAGARARPDARTARPTSRPDARPASARRPGPTPEPPPPDDPPPPSPPPPAPPLQPRATATPRLRLSPRRCRRRPAARSICLAGGNYGTWNGTSKAITCAPPTGATPADAIQLHQRGRELHRRWGLRRRRIDQPAARTTSRSATRTSTRRFAFDGAINSDDPASTTTCTGTSTLPLDRPNAMITLHYDSSQHSGITIQNSLLRERRRGRNPPSIAVNILNNTLPQPLRYRRQPHRQHPVPGRATGAGSPGTTSTQTSAARRRD